MTESAMLNQYQTLKTGTVDDYNDEVTRLREENHSLKLRVVGVNELARLLQDRTDVVQALEDKNKRLEVAVVRLENRCSNFERRLKSQGGTAAPRPGQSPFIPGPSRQILEALMKENSELKKTLNKVSKRGASGYLEAVKISQLEEVIDSQKQEMDFLKNQIQSLTSSTFAEEEGAREFGERSLPTMGGSVDTGPLKRQLIKMQHALKVKDRFCTLLSQQVAGLQQKLANAERDVADAARVEGKSQASVEIEDGEPLQENTPHSSDPHSDLREPPSVEDRDSSEPDHHRQMTDLEAKFKKLMQEQKDELEKERGDKVSLTMTLAQKEEMLKTKTTEIENLENRCEDLTVYNQTLLDEKTSLTKSLAEAEVHATGWSEGTLMKELEDKLAGFEQELEEKERKHADELDNKNKEVNHLRMMLEDSHYRLAITDSKLASLANEKDQVIEGLRSKLEDLEIEYSALKSHSQEVAEKKRQLECQIGHLRASPRPIYGSTVGSLGPMLVKPTPSLIYQDQYRRDVVVADSGRPKTAPQHPSHLDTMSSRPFDSHCGSNIVDQMYPKTLIARTPDTATTSPNLTLPLQGGYSSRQSSQSSSSLYAGSSALQGSASGHRQSCPQISSSSTSPYQNVLFQSHPGFSTSQMQMRSSTMSPQGRTSYTSPVGTPMGYPRPSPYTRSGYSGTHPSSHTTVIQSGQPTSSQSSSYYGLSSSIPSGHHSAMQQPMSLSSPPISSSTPPFMSNESAYESMMSSSYPSGSLGPQTQGGKPYDKSSTSPHDQMHYHQ